MSAARDNATMEAGYFFFAAPVAVPAAAAAFSFLGFLASFIFFI